MVTANHTFSSILALLGCLAMLPAQALNHEDVVAPITAPRFPVACSNVEHDLERLAQLGGSPVDYWEGNTVNGSPRYVTDILKYPGTAVTFDPRVPARPELYPTRMLQRLDFAAIVCYPTSRANTDPDYELPGNGGTVPRMQRPGEAPRFLSIAEYAEITGTTFDPTPPAGPYKFPLVVYSHGLGGSPLGEGYLEVMVALAAQGFVVSGVFHADARISLVRLEDLGDVVFTLVFFPLIVEMQAMRPFALKALADRMLGDPGYARGIDAERIGGFGASLGGEAMAHLVGAGITCTLAGDCAQPERDPRVRAVVGYVPYSGFSFLPAFCDGQEGARGVDRPYLAIGGTLDTTAPINMTRRALTRMGSSRYLVELVGGEHELRPQDAGDVLTWTVTFLNAYLGSPTDPLAMSRFIRMAGVTGGRPDALTMDVHVPFPGIHGDVPVVEFRNEATDHYFMAAGQGEIDGILAGAAGPGWELTGQSFKAWLEAPSPTLHPLVGPVCRFYGAPAGGPNSHFFTASASECETVKRAGGWFYEGIGFHLTPVANGPGGQRRCPDGYLSVNRAYNNRAAQNDSNHRFTTSDSEIRAMGERGWAVEGTVMCVYP
jgi:predicted dienelactone hydrolase